MSTLSDWIVRVSAELGIDELGELVDPEVVTPLVLDMTRDVAHGVARPAAPITAYLLGLAVARAAGSGPADPEAARAQAAVLAALALGEDPDAGGTEGAGPGERPPGSEALPAGAPAADEDAGTAADPAVGSN